MSRSTLGHGRIELGEASDEEISLFQRPLPGTAADTLSGWHLIAVRRPVDRRLQLVVAGTSDRTRRWWLSSPLLALDGLRMARTVHGRLYALGVRSLEDADDATVARVRQALSRAGRL